MALFVFTAGYRALTDQYNFLLWAGACGLLGGLGLLAGWRQHRRVRHCAVPGPPRSGSSPSPATSPPQA